MARDLPHDEPRHEDNLLVEAVSLLVQRQRETEAWVAEQIELAEERAGSVERHYSEVEARLARLEEELERLALAMEPGRTDSAGGQRLARLREQVADLKASPDAGRPLRSVPPAPAVPPPEMRTPVAEPPSAPVVVAATVAPSPWNVIGATSSERFGLLAIFLGLVAVLYAILLQFRLG